ncbi:MAG: hypothetical protein DYG88_01240 [Chloroflexi bacterium CFX4]|nr:hypothetical protein [Chloroflexi bacterium CFX4]
MTRAELELLIERAAAGVLTEFLHHLTELAATQSSAALPSESATLQALLEAFEATRWTPPDGTPSPVEVLRAMRRGESV